VAVIATTAVFASSASATTVEVGRCVKKPAAGGSGYSESGCRHGASTGAKYEWLGGPGPQPGFTMRERFVFSGKHHYCTVALSELRLAAEDKTAAESASEPERAELLRAAAVHEKVAEAKLAQAKKSVAGCEALLKTEEAKVPVKLETHKGSVIECGGLAASGRYTDEQSLGELQVKFTECESGGVACTSEGLSEGEVTTAVSSGELGIITNGEGDASPTVGFRTYPTEAGAPVAEFGCGETKIVVTGSVIHEIKIDKMQSTEKVNFTESKGEQRPESFEGFPTSVLSMSIGGREPQQAGLKIKALLENEERIEVRATA